MTPTPIKKCHSSMLVSVSRALKGSPRTKTTLMAASQSHSIPLSGSHYSFNRLSHCPPIHLGLPRVIEPIAGQTEMLPFWIQTLKPSHHAPMAHTKSFMLLLLLSRFSRVRLCATQQTVTPKKQLPFAEVVEVWLRYLRTSRGRHQPHSSTFGRGKKKCFLSKKCTTGSEVFNMKLSSWKLRIIDSILNSEKKV